MAISSNIFTTEMFQTLLMSITVLLAIYDAISKNGLTQKNKNLNKDLKNEYFKSFQNFHFSKYLYDLQVSAMFQKYFKIKIRPELIPLYMIFLKRHNLTHIMLQLLEKHNFLIFNESRKTLKAKISKWHRIKYYLNIFTSLLLVLIYVILIIAVIFIPFNNNPFLPIYVVLTALTCLIISVFIMTRFVSPYNWAKRIINDEK
jgi:ABC-type multidrug transport system fused ATPase/permease subunit